MNRQLISELFDKTICIRRPSKHESASLRLSPGSLVAIDLEKGEICAQLGADDIFDAQGNRFEHDL